MQDDDFSSANVLLAAKGPLAPTFRAYVPDAQGRWRLSFPESRKQWTAYTEQASNHYGFNEEQRKQAQGRLKARVDQLNWYLNDNGEDIREYINEWDRLELASADRGLASVEFRRSWIQEKETELRGKARPWLQQVAAIRESLADDLYNIHLTGEGTLRSRYQIPDPGHNWMDTFVTWLTFLVGVCLILGLFTRTASIAGALFLFSVILTQPPWIPDAADTYYQMVEMLALVVLAAAAAGRYAGLDFLLHSLWLYIRSPKQAAPAESA